MLLAIDCGNTNTVFSIWDGSRFLATWRTATEHQRTADQYYVWLCTLMKLHHLDVAIDEVIVSSTVPRVVFNLRVLCDRYFGTRPLVVGRPDCRLPVDVRVDEGTAVGPDRLVNTVAATTCTVATPSSLTSAPPPPSTSWTPTAPMWAASSRPA